MVTEKETRVIRITQQVYDFIDESANKSTETFDDILRRLLKIK